MLSEVRRQPNGVEAPHGCGQRLPFGDISTTAQRRFIDCAGEGSGKICNEYTSSPYIPCQK
jgi:hypothetical protein